MRTTPTKRPRSTKRLTTLAVLGVILAGLVMSACTPEEQAAATAVISHHQAVLADWNSKSLSDAQLARLANCESGGNPAARSKSGKYLGLYQFDQGTWNGTARSVLPAYVGVSPAAAPAEVQDAMARALYNSRGRSPWPVCGRRL